MILVSEITLDDFKSWFVRDFKYATPVGETIPLDVCDSEMVTDLDLTKAFTEAQINFNESLFSDDAHLKTAFFYLVAHYLVNDLQTAIDGPTSAGTLPVISRSVGSVSESYDLPTWAKNDPNLAYYITTRYGQKYLSIIKPLLVGNVMVYQGATTYR